MNPELNLTAGQMREMGYRVVDLLVDHLSTLPDQRVGAKGNPAELLGRFSRPAPEHGTAFQELLAEIETHVLANTMHVNHPRFFAYVPGPGNFVSAMADAIASAYNVFAGTWVSGSGPTAMELETMGWLRTICGIPESGGGLFVSGGTVANVTAMAVARHVKLGEHDPNAVVYCSDQTHSSCEKGLRMLGFSPWQIRALASDGEFRLPLSALDRAIDEDAANGLRPFCIIANAGTTNTGAVDPLPALAKLARERGLWLHIDGAYGAAAALCERGRSLLEGLGEADSISLDPHKWLFQPFETGCVLVRRVSDLTDTFRILPEYLQDTQSISAEINFTDRGLQLTRSFRALKLWLSVRYFGLASFRAAIERGFALAEFTEAEIRKMPRWEIVTPAQMGILCFRYRGADDRFHLELVQRILTDGFALVTSTVLRGTTTLRMCTINPRTSESDILLTLRRLDELALEQR